MQTTTLVTIGEFLLDLDPSRPSLGLEHELAVHFTSASVSLEMCYAKVLLDACALADSKWAAQAPTFASLSACACRPMGITSEIVDLHFHSPTAMRFTGSLLSSLGLPNAFITVATLVHRNLRCYGACTQRGSEAAAAKDPTFNLSGTPVGGCRAILAALPGPGVGAARNVRFCCVKTRQGLRSYDNGAVHRLAPCFRVTRHAQIRLIPIFSCIRGFIQCSILCVHAS